MDYYTSRAIVKDAARKDISISIQTNNIFIKNSSTAQYNLVSAGANTTITYSNDNNNDICGNVVSGIIYYIQTSGNTIVSVNVDVFLYDQITSTQNSSSYIQQFFQVKFVDTSVKFLEKWNEINTLSLFFVNFLEFFRFRNSRIYIWASFIDWKAFLNVYKCY